MIGLKRNTVKIVPYDNEWPTYFLCVSRELSKELNIEISSFHHFGSTSISGCSAKPIIDMAIEIENLIDAGSYVPKLQKMGYGLPWTHVLPDRVCMPGKGEITTVNLYFVDRQSITLKNWLTFRDRMISDVHLKKEYIDLKNKLASENPTNRGAYTKAKTSFVKRVLCPNS